MKKQYQKIVCIVQFSEFREPTWVEGGSSPSWSKTNFSIFSNPSLSTIQWTDQGHFLCLMA